MYYQIFKELIRYNNKDYPSINSQKHKYIEMI